MNKSNQTPHAGMASPEDNSRSAASKIKTGIEHVADEGRGLMQSAKEKAIEFGSVQAEATSGLAADNVESVGSALNSFADSLREGDQETLANYATRIADTVNDVATGLRERSIDTMISDVNRLARRNPGAFLIGSVAAGFVLSRFLRATGERELRPSTTPSESGNSAPYPFPTSASMGAADSSPQQASSGATTPGSGGAMAPSGADTPHTAT